MQAPNSPQGFNPNNLNLTQALAKEVDTIPNTRPQGVSQAEVKQALDIVANNPELREAIWQKGQAALRENPPNLKKHCEDIAGDYKHGDSNVEQAFVTLFASLTLGFAKFLKNPNKDLQIEVNEKLVPGLFIKLRNGHVTVTNLIDQKGSKNEARLLTLVRDFHNSDFATGKYKEKPQPAVQRFQAQQQAEVYRGPGQHPAPMNQQFQVNPSPFGQQPQIHPQHQQWNLLQQGYQPQRFGQNPIQPQPGQQYQPPLNATGPGPVLGPRPVLPSEFGTNLAFSKFDNAFKEKYDALQAIASVPAGKRNTWQVHFDRIFNELRIELSAVPRTTDGFAVRENFLQTYQHWINAWINETPNSK